MKSEMKSEQIRQKFIDYFSRNGHTLVPSSSLIPEEDPTLLFANAGMNQFKNTFLGLDHRPYQRAVSVQKCVRAGGKHNDLDNVGFTARHHTFFEMLGNFSFGDYFKKEAIHFAWEFLTQELGISRDKLYVTVFEKDDEAAEIWHKQEGIPLNHIFKMGEKDNFWRMGEVGPCGPCSEVYYDQGPLAGKESDPYLGILSGEDRFIEVWNLVFMQFDEKAPGILEPLPKPSVDTGAGLERLSSVLQGKINNYDSDLFFPLIEKASQLLKKDFNRLTEDQKAAIRVLADHTRSSSFLIADGALPSNEGRGYVLRRIIRRALRYGRKLSSEVPFLTSLAEVMIGKMGESYKELMIRKSLILSVLKEEETRFLTTLDQGTQILNEEIGRLKKKGSREFPGDLAFKLYDTYGFPFDLTCLMLAEIGMSVREESFQTEMKKAKEKAKMSWKGKSLAADQAHLMSLAQSVLDQHQKVTEFVGYDHLMNESHVIALSNGSERVNDLTKGQNGIMIVLSTPFYAESGGQVGDHGTWTQINLNNNSKGIVTHTEKYKEVFFHHIYVEEGSLSINDKLQLNVTESERRETAHHHSATHLLHAALRKVLGDHVIQAGSLVDSTKLRFDFQHNKPIGEKDLENIENLVNEQIALSLQVHTQTLSYSEAIQSGAVALFGEKYGDQVRVIKMGPFSSELCGGTHVQNTSQIRFFKIISESGVSAGVRRVEALAGKRALQFAMKNIKETQLARVTVGITENGLSYLESNQSLLDWIESKKKEIKSLEQSIRTIKSDQINIQDLLKSSQKFIPSRMFPAVAGIQNSPGPTVSTSKVETHTLGGRGPQSAPTATIIPTESESISDFPGEAVLVVGELAIDDREILSKTADQIKEHIGAGVIFLIGQGEATHPLLISVSPNLNPYLHAGNILKTLAPLMGGKGGGRPDFAQGAVPQRQKFPEALRALQNILGI